MQSSDSSERPAALLDFFDLEDDADAVVTSHELSVARSKLGHLLDLLPAGLLIHQEQSVVYANLEAARILGLTMEELVGHHVLDFVAEPDGEAISALFRACLREHRLIRSKDCTLTSVGGTRTNVQVSMSPLPWDGLPVIYVLITDVTAMKETEDRLRHLSVTDPLTGAHNRRYFIDAAENEIAQARRAGQSVGLLAIDIDYFKRINDTHGHAVGDEALKLFTDACRHCLRSHDVFGRMGGEEFAVLLPDTDAEGVLAVAERIRVRMTEVRVPAVAENVGFTISIGALACRAGERDIDSMLSTADKALYRAKATGRNRVVIAADTAADTVGASAA